MTMKTNLTCFNPARGTEPSNAPGDCGTLNVLSRSERLRCAPQHSGFPSCRTFGLALSLAVALVAAVSSIFAAPPELMTYQGFLVDGNGSPLAQSAPANYPVTFRIFTAPINGTRLWSEQQIVTVDKGNFSVVLGEGTAVDGEVRPLLSSVLAGPANADRYMSLSVTIGTTTSEMLPRLRLLPSPYAFTATSANNLVNPSGTPVLSYANSRVEVNGTLFASGGLTGDGSGLTGITAAQVSGTFVDSQFPPNVARRDVPNTFTGFQTINGNLGLGTSSSAFPLTIGNNTLGDKLSLWGQGGNSFGLGVAPSLLQIHADNVGSDIGFGYGSSAAMTETMRIKGNGNVGVGTPAPSARLSLVAAGASELQGSARSTTLLTSAGTLGNTAGSELGLASIGFGSVNNSSLGIRASRVANGSDWTSTSIGLGMDVDNTVRAGASLWLHANGNVGVGTSTPSAKLEVNGPIKGASLTVGALTVNGPVNAATFNGEKAPQTFTIPQGNLNSWRELQMDATSLLGDADGGRMKIIVRNHSTKEVRTLSYEFYAENDGDNFGQPLRYGWTVSSYGGERGFKLGSGTTDWRTDIASDWSWYWIRNYRSGAAFGGVDAPAENAANRYKFWILVPPNITITVILYDR